ncbi:recombinase family protein [Clostridium lacusfryxellense]|uniref:recombinase family protein n=1 Tax=Clostridium lacusfryxellense TaxID=205328 RepID=UPI001C0B48CA|nr:recombinase family protein [Clostridium lacusfryxellense]MBU3110293.1 recombinase family protein [Clostridium lacusfryxellense]
MPTISTEQTKNIIKDVAIYLRKSRGVDEDLQKHRTALEELCLIKNWRYTEYGEIGSSDSIVSRPQMIQLLKDVENEMYDAVVVIDIDRLSRGDGEEQARIKNILRRSGTLIVTPNKVYDLEDDGDDMYSDFEGFIARAEYKQIKKRLKRGKKQGSRRGDWTNGTPPYPYVYQEWYDENSRELFKKDKGLVVNREKYTTYRTMLEKVIVDGITPNEIAWELNRKGSLSPRGGRWHGATIQRILVDETHMGKIISNKSAGDGHAEKRSKDSKDLVHFSKDKWVIVENCHEAVKTQEEHNKLLLFFGRETKTPRRKGTRIFPLSGLLKCSRCGHTMVMNYRADRKSQEYIKPCWYHDAVGNKCGNSGSDSTIVHEQIMIQLDKKRQELKENSKKDGGENDSVLREIKMILTEIAKLEKKMIRIDELVEDEYYTLPEAIKRKSDLKTLLDEAETKLTLYQLKLNSNAKVTSTERLLLIDKFIEEIAQENLTPKEINELYKRVVSHIIWDRKKDDYVVEVNFL